MTIHNFTIHRLSEGEFNACRDEWQDLLGRSDGDPLFNSWYWAREWWRSRPEELRASTELCVVVVKQPGGRWVGLAPCYIAANRHFGIRAHCLHMLGSGLPKGNLFRAEYRSLLLDSAEADGVLPQLIGGLDDLPDWDEAMLSDVPRNSHLIRRYESAIPRRWFRREVNPGVGHFVELGDGFAAYQQSLKGSARRQMFNKRRRLMDHDNVAIKRSEDISPDELIDILNRFHQSRFHRNVVGPAHVDFLTRLGAYTEANAPRLSHSMICADGRPVAVAMDIDADSRRYNIQLGFDEGFDQALSPGLLNLGYAMEHAAERGLTRYDFLIGGGLHDDYKQRFETGNVSVSTLHWVRSAWLRWPHRIYRWLRR